MSFGFSQNAAFAVVNAPLLTAGVLGPKKYFGGLAIGLLFSLLGCAGGTQQQPMGGPPAQPPTIAFLSSRALDGSNAPNATGNLWIVHTDGTGLTALTKLTASQANPIGALWSPDASRIAFESLQALDGSDAVAPSFIFNIWTMKSDGTGATPLTKLTASGASSLSPIWSPDGTKILFTSARALDGSDTRNANGTSNVWVMSADGSGARALTTLTANGAAGLLISASWSPSGGQIVFSSARALDGSDAANPNSVVNIWVMNADGTGAKPLTLLTSGGIACFNPVWSPDGAKLAFASNRALDGSDALLNALNIWVINADGSGAMPLTRLTATGVVNSEPDWSPNGRKIAFLSSRAVDGSDAINPADNLWVVNSDGSGAMPFTRLTATIANSFDAGWSADGSQLAFTSQRALDGSDTANTNQTQNIWLINSDGTNAKPLTQLTAFGANSNSPTWRR
jgi:Tol biopolymer transport system component